MSESHSRTTAYIRFPPELTKKMVGTLVDAVFAELGDYFVKAKVTRQKTPRFTRM